MNRRIIIFIMIISFLNVTAQNSNLKRDEINAFEDGYSFAKENSNHVSLSFIYKSLLKASLYKSCSSAVCLLSILEANKNKELDCLGLGSFIVFLNTILIIYEIPIYIIEFNKSKELELNKLINLYFKNNIYSQEYKKNFIDGVNSYLSAAQRR